MIKIEIQCETDSLDAHMLALGFVRGPIVQYRWGSDNKYSPIDTTNAQPEGGDAHAAGLVPAEATSPDQGKITSATITNVSVFVDPQDEADEQSETEANKSDKLTLNDVRLAVERYSAAHGIPAAIENIAKIVGCSIVELPAEDQAALKSAIDKIDWAAAQPKDASKQESKPNGAAKIATRDDVVAAMKRYAKKYDGQDTDLTKVPHTTTDVMATLKKTFGDKVTKLSEIPATPEGYGAALAAINEALEKNTFNRAAK